MTPERWQKVKEVLGEAMEAPPGSRPALLERICAGDESLRREVQALLDRESHLDSQFLSQTDLASATADLLPSQTNPWVGRRVGAYKIIEQIGAGGMGEVYRAVRDDDQYKKEVALKVVRSSQGSAFIVSRFKNERQILASLDHPNIARLLDGGTTEEGMPYLVMELIAGRPITEYCADRNLSVADRLALFVHVCAAVQYAHQRLVVHRDIKPGNILVTAEGVPKLLDFGIAKILDVAGDPYQVEATLTVFRLLTPQYASPEQVRGEPITTASDVYSLGVVLYELLTASSPYPQTSGAPQDLVRSVCDFEPPRPSTAVRQRIAPAPRSTAPAHPKPQLGSEKLARQLSGDLDNIVLMALRKEPQRRYISAEQFSEDIRRYLEKLPVVARKDTARYRASKFVTRHKAAVAAAVAVALTLVVALVITMREAQIANRRFNDVRSLANSLIFDVHDSIKDLPGSTPAKKIIVDHALQYLNGLARESSGDLGLQRELASAYEKVGSVQGDYLENNLGDAEGTLASYRKAFELRRQIDARSSDWNDHIALAQDYRLLAHQLWANGDARGARDPIAHAIAISDALNRAQPNNTKILGELSFDYEVSGRIGYPGDPDATTKIVDDYRHALAVDEVAVKLQPNDLPTLHGYATDLSGIGGMLEATDPRAALANYQKSLAMDQRLTQLSSDLRFRRSVAIDHANIASVYDNLGEYALALENNLMDLEIYQDLNRADPKNALLKQGLAIAYANTASSASRLDRTDMALDYSARAAEIIQALVASAPPSAFQRKVHAAIAGVRGTVLIRARQPEAAASELHKARGVYEMLYKAGTLDSRSSVASCNVKLGEAAAQLGRESQAADYFHQALAIVEPLTAASAPDLDALYASADAYFGLGELSRKKAQQRGLARSQQQVSWAEAKTWYEKSMSAWHRIEHPNHTAPDFFQVGDPAVVAKQLKAAEAALSRQH